MIKNFLKQLICIKCKNKLFIKKITTDHNRIVNGILICNKCKVNYPISKGVIDFSNNNKIIIGSSFIIIFIIFSYGVSKLEVENRFIDYFDNETEIYQGMYEIDSKLGGTATLDIIISEPTESDIPEKSKMQNIATNVAVIANDFSFDDLFEDDLFEDRLVMHLAIGGILTL